MAPLFVPIGAVTAIGAGAILSKSLFSKSNTTPAPQATPATQAAPDASSIASASQTNGTTGSNNPAAKLLLAQNSKGFASNSQNTARSFLLSI